MKSWFFYRIYGDAKDGLWYYRILDTVVRPFVEQNQERIDAYYFFHYYPEAGPDRDCEPPQEPEKPQAFIRLKIRAEEEHIPTLNAALVVIMDSSDAVTYRQRCSEDIEEGLGRLFGLQDPEPVVRYLHSVSELALRFLEEGKRFNAKNVVEAMHLAANVLDYGFLGGEIVGVQCSRLRRVPNLP